MKAAKAWCVAGLFVLTGFSSTSCGKDEITDGGKGGTGSILPEGGSGGTVIGRAGTRNGGGTGGSGGGVVGTSGTKLGSGCINDVACEDAKAPGLKCVTASDPLLGPGAPPKGLCTAECDLEALEDPCAQFGAGAICYPFDADSTSGYCIEGCSFGEPDIGDLKCHDREEFACNPALLGDTGEPCTATDDCQAGELCIDDTCAVVFPACLPSCRGDIDCEDGMYCDQSFLSGVCLTEKPTGKGLGEPCTVPAATEPSEPDECLGFCQADAADSTEGHCAVTCGLLAECAYNSTSGKFDGACFYASILTAETGFIGDFGFCTPSCNCTEECNDADLACSLLTQGELTDAFRGPGLCFSPDPMTEEYNQCGTGGSGPTGEAGAASGGGGAGG